MAGHTPGPWEWRQVDGEPDVYHLVAVGDYGNSWNYPQIHSDGSACGEYGPDIDVHGPDAKLIAAAPEMLAALKESQTILGELMLAVDELLAPEELMERCGESITKTDAAIQKAEGE